MTKGEMRRFIYGMTIGLSFLTAYILFLWTSGGFYS